MFLETIPAAGFKPSQVLRFVLGLGLELGLRFGLGLGNWVRVRVAHVSDVPVT